MTAMSDLAKIAPAFVEMAHRIVWCSAATVDKRGRPRSRVLHPLWRWDGAKLEGVIATSPTLTKRAHLDASAHVSLNYWAPSHDTCLAECRARWAFDDATRERVWNAFKAAPAPVGYDPSIVPSWKGGPTSAEFAVLVLEPWRLRVMPGTVMLGGGGEVLLWREFMER
jgi:hypothetical protein